ncbi:hypothetical protein BN946_scf184859.g4 [Trametes cinnabarina]|uniref:Uncharacterized protein n=1 Tax=Pycnoporus cinnabarinus TaxID=5643 RepID=A0A060SQ08_PYCCI|nr:hypothetical protein BN946_scf184859.g4 [Trametes cinnabarina]
MHLSHCSSTSCVLLNSLTEYITHKDAKQCALIMSLIHLYTLYNFRYPPFLTPDNHVHLPLSGDSNIYDDHSTLTPHGFYPTYCDPVLCKHSIMHYRCTITLAEPPVGLIAKLLYIAIQEHVLPVKVDMPVPLDHEEAIQLYISGPTHADYLEFVCTHAVVLNARADLDEDGISVQEEECTWCRDDASLSTLLERPFSGESPSSLSFVRIAANTAVGSESSRTPTGPDFSEHPLTFTLCEHHCISPSAPFPHPEPLRGPLNKGIMNDFFPHSFPTWPSISERGGKLYIHRWHDWVYETHIEGKPSAHDEDTCEMCCRCRRLENVQSACWTFTTTPKQTHKHR